MKILNSVTDPRVGGPQLRSLKIAQELRERAIRTMFLVPQGSDEFTDEISEAGFQHFRIKQPRLRRPQCVRENARFVYRFLPTMRTAKRIINRENINVAHVNMETNLAIAAGAHRSEAKLVWHINGLTVPFPVNRIIGRLARRWADKIIVSSGITKEYYFPESTETMRIYPPVDLNEFDPQKVTPSKASFQSDLGLPSDCPVVGTVGNISPLKGYESFLKAVRRTVDGFGQIAVPIIGAEYDSQSRYSTHLHQIQTELGLDEIVKFVGWRSDIPELMSMFDLFVLPSLSETGPMVVLEAMAMNCPVVMTNVGLIPEEFEHREHGWIVEPGDPAQLGDAMISALQSPTDRREFAASAREKVEQSLSLSEAVGRHVDVYTSVVGE